LATHADDGSLLYTEEQPIVAADMEATDLVALIAHLVSHVLNEFSSRNTQNNPAAPSQTSDTGAAARASFGTFSKLMSWLRPSGWSVPRYLPFTSTTAENNTHLCIRGVGIGCPGQSRDGVLIAASNFPKLKNAPLVEMMQGYRLFAGIPCILVNDADAAVAAEVWAAESKAAYSHAQNIAMITLGTGIGVGLVLNHRLYQGSFGCVEAGHMIIDTGADALQCGCGQRGCVETFASAENLSRIYSAKLAAFARGSGGSADESKSSTHHALSLSSQLSAAPPPLPEELADAAKAQTGGSRYVFSMASQHPASLAAFVLDAACRQIAVLCINLCRVVDPRVIIIGGGMSKAGNPLLERVLAHVKASTWTVLPTDVEIVIAQGMENSGTIGAALASRNYAAGMSVMSNIRYVCVYL